MLSVSVALFIGYIIFHLVIMLYVLLFLSIWVAYNLEIFSLKISCPSIFFLEQIFFVFFKVLET